MNVVVIGLGSMGRRRVRLLKEYFGNKNSSEWGSVFGVDFNEERRRRAQSEFDINCFSSFQEAVRNCNFDAAIISTPPLSHNDYIKECLQNNMHVFTEINLVPDGYDDNIALANNRKKVLFLSSTPMYRLEMQHIKKTISSCDGTRFTYRYYIGQYLPDWHPWENYNNFFASDKRTNGCREIFAIELPWMTDAFGEIANLSSCHTKVTDLGLDYDDTYHVIINHESGVVGQISVDVATPVAKRHLEILGEKFYLEWNGTADSLREYDESEKKLKPIHLYDKVTHDGDYNSFIIENAYYDEMVKFFDVVKGAAVSPYDFNRDKKVLSWIDRIEK